MRVVLVGMNNPRLDLFPVPPNSTGGRLARLAGLSWTRYLKTFDRVNVLRSREWNDAAARFVGPFLARELTERGAPFVCVGDRTRRALGLPGLDPATWYVTEETTWSWIPHPSGRNRWYNDDENRRTVERFFEQTETQSRET